MHGESEQARGFYGHLILEFERSPTDSLHLLAAGMKIHLRGQGVEVTHIHRHHHLVLREGSS